MFTPVETKPCTLRIRDPEIEEEETRVENTLLTDVEEASFPLF